MSNLSEILELLVQQHASNLDYDFPQSFSPFLKTNNLPAESDAKVLEDLSKDVSDALRLITSDMESLMAAHSQLKNIQDHLLRVDADIKTAMPPIERLPVEMLTQVFKEATSEMGDALDMRWKPFVISRVCHKWRVVATEQCPDIWSEFMLERPSWDDMKDPVALLSLVLSRGAERSLEFNFEAAGGNDVSECESEKNSEEGSSDEEEEEDDDEIYARRPSYYSRDDGVTERLLQGLVRHCHRWRDVYFSIPARLFHLLSPIRGNLPALVLFSLDCVADDLAIRSSILTASHILDGAPLLEDVSVSCSTNDFPVLIPRGVPNLTSYTDDRPRIGDVTLHQHFLNIIRTSPHLKGFSVKHKSPLTLATPPSRIVHPCITWLSAADGTFLRSLTLPGLKNVELSRCSSASPSELDIHYEISSLYDLVIHSACALSSLRVVHCAVNENLIHILEASPDLTSLLLDFSS
ncbi:hypothetical protein EV421DRAFT_1507569 [Armillaria borealis]|uniref:F-box domain-containing protein n=1 Tax=Armillaria borealis TaxID=47425 RepID=A0AA39IYQ8_9AGAR|nr:hypothetical protein EV421DRAFT_1507569 [Armillaria borealis]